MLPVITTGYYSVISDFHIQIINAELVKIGYKYWSSIESSLSRNKPPRGKNSTLPCESKHSELRRNWYSKGIVKDILTRSPTHHHSIKVRTGIRPGRPGQEDRRLKNNMRQVDADLG